MSSGAGDEAGMGTMAAAAQQPAQDALASYKRDRGEVSSKAQAPVGDSTWQDVRSKWLRKSAEYDSELEAARRERRLSERNAESKRNSRFLSFDIVERHLSNGQPFPKPLPVPVLVAILNEIWDEEGL